MSQSRARLLLLVPSFPRVSETFIFNKFLGMLRNGWDVHVLCWQSDPAEWDRFQHLINRSELKRRVHLTWPRRPRWLLLLLLPAALLLNICCNTKSTLRYLYRGWRLFNLGVFRQFYLDREVININPDIINFEFGSLSINRMHLKELLSCKIVVSFRGYDLNYVGLENSEFYSEIWEKADTIHFLSKAMLPLAEGRGFNTRKSYAIISPAIDPAFFNPVHHKYSKISENPGGYLRILSVGRLGWIKGYEYALQAVKILLNKGIRFEYRIIGDGEYLEAVAFARHQLGLENVLYLYGSQTTLEIRNQLLWADVFLHAAVSEGFCNAVLEAQAMAVPVVCSDSGGLPENVSNGETGFVAPRRDPYALADKLIILAKDATLRQKMGYNGRKRILERFLLDDQIIAFERLYLKAFNGNTFVGTHS